MVLIVENSPKIEFSGNNFRVYSWLYHLYGSEKLNRNAVKASCNIFSV